MNVSFYWLENTGVSLCSSPLENVAYEFVLTSPVVPSIRCSSFLESFRDGRWDGLFCLAVYQPFSGHLTPN